MIGTDMEDDEDMIEAFNNDEEEMREKMQEVEKKKNMAENLEEQCTFLFTDSKKQCPKRKDHNANYCDFHNHVIFSPELRQMIHEIHEGINRLIQEHNK